MKGRAGTLAGGPLSSAVMRRRRSPWCPLAPLVAATLTVALSAALPLRAEDPDVDVTGSSEGSGVSFRSIITGEWLDPTGQFWRPRRGDRTEVSVLIGGEGALGELGSLERIPSVGGTTLTVSGHYYPVDRLAISVGAKSYLGLDRPAPGTTASTVLAPFAGVRWDLVRENRFSLLADLQSGPAFFAFADILDALDATWAVGGEATLAFPFRYSLGPWTAELRPFFGGRVGTAADIGRPRFDVGPFSALYAGADLGLTWTFGADEEETRRHAEAAKLGDAPDAS